MGNHLEYECARQLFAHFLANLPQVEVTMGAEATVTSDDGMVFQLQFAVGWSDVNVVQQSDRDLLLWLLRDALETGNPNVKWTKLREYREVEGQTPPLRALYESALRISSTLILYRCGNKVAGKPVGWPSGGSFRIADGPKFNAAGRQARSLDGLSYYAAGPYRTGKTLSFKLTETILSMAQSALGPPKPNPGQVAKGVEFVA